MPRCNLCLKNHAIRHCKHFTSMTIEERRSYVTRWNYCLNCLAHSHPRGLCQSANRCAICGAKHHSMVHRDRPEDVSLSSSYEQEESQSAELGLQVPQLHPPQQDVDNHTQKVEQPPVLSSSADLSLSLPVEDRYIPPLVRVNLIHKGNPMWVTFLLDPKTDYSFLLRSVARVFPGFEADYRRGDIEYGEFQVAPTYEPRSHYGHIARWRLQIRNDFISLPPPIHDPQLMEHFSQMTPHAHPGFAVSRDIDGIISGKTLNTICTNDIIQPQPMLPKAQRSIFGWVISGVWHGCNCH